MEIERLLSYHYLKDNQTSGDRFCYSIPGTEIWETITPWHPTYWKTLSCGYAVSYQFKCIPVDLNSEYINPSPAIRIESQKAEDWLSQICNWYDNYYQDCLKLGQIGCDR